MPPKKTINTKNGNAATSGFDTELIKQEYSVLVNLFVHYENNISSMYNFYLTLITTILGAVFLLLQLAGSRPNASYLSIEGLLVFVLILGGTTYEAILNKIVDRALVTQSINSIKANTSKHYKEITEDIYYFVSPQSAMPKSEPARKTDGLWFFRNIDAHLSFITLFSALAIDAFIVALILWTAPNSTVTWKIIAVSVTIGLAIFFIHLVYSNFEFSKRLQIKRSKMSRYAN